MMMTMKVMTATMLVMMVMIGPLCCWMSQEESTQQYLDSPLFSFADACSPVECKYGANVNRNK